MKIRFIGMSEEITGGAELLCEQLGFEIDESGALINVGKCEAGFCVSVKNNAAEIKYERLNDFFRALAVAIHALKSGENTELKQSGSFESCGIMLDVSRRAVLKVESVKRIMRYMACMGLNRLMLYTEDTYEMDGHPYFGYMRGRYTKDEIKEIVSYGDMLGIESVPCIQTLAHLNAAIKWNEFADVRDTWDILLVGEEKTYELIEDMIRTMRECFTSKSIHIGMDEAHDVGLGRYMDIHGYTDRLKILCEHLARTNEIVRKYDFEPMMWSDMVFHLMKKSGKPEMTEETAKMFPEGLAQVFWDYYSRSEKHYDDRVSEHMKMKCPLVFAGGIWTWSGPSVNYAQTFEATLPALRVCKKYGIKHIFATLWGDDGAECDALEALYGMQLYAEINYNNSLTKAELDRMFKICTDCDAEAFLLLDTENYYGKPCLPEKEVFDDEKSLDGILTFSKQVLYQNPIMGLFDKNFEGVDLKAHYTALHKRLESLCVPKGFEQIYGYHKQLVKILMSKCDIGIRLKAAYDERNMTELSLIADELGNLSRELVSLYDLRRTLWYQNNKPFGFEAVGNRMMAASAMAENARIRVNEFINEEVGSLDELETERLYYNLVDRPFVWEFTGGKIMMP